MYATTYKATVARAAKIIGAAIKGAEDAMLDGRLEHEPAMTDRMLGRIEQAFEFGEGIQIKNIVWKAKTLTDRGPRSQESRMGADFMGVLEVNVPGYQVSKGFLAQAKMIRRSGYLDTRELCRQCELMLALSPASYVFLYGEKGVEVISANAVIATGGNLDAVQRETALKFFKNHLACMIGDRAISSATPEGLAELQKKADVRQCLVISAQSRFL
jgi:hypothetical protein